MSSHAQLPQLVGELIKESYRKTITSSAAYGLHKYNYINNEKWDTNKWIPIVFSLPYIGFYAGKYMAKRINYI